MWKWFRQNRVAVVLGVLLVYSLAGNVMAAGGLTEITAHLNSNIKIALHGQLFEPIEPTDGSRMVPITYKGRTYLPLRAVAEAVGLNVTWDPNTETAYLGNEARTIEKQISYITVSPEYVSTDKEWVLKSREPDRLTYGNGNLFDTGYTTEVGYGGIYARILTNYEFDKFKASIWVDDAEPTDEEAEIEFRDEHDSLVKSFKVKWGEVLNVELDIKDVQELTVSIPGDKSILGNPMLGK